jgi:L-ascorbate metabolism protein UlaG (beta-lactamase superfamily)
MQISRQNGFPAPGERSLTWLGQAGFWLDTGAHRVLIDPYLSDSLARKYAGSLHDHQRMMAPPITPEHLPQPDVVLITHAHTDHMDPDTLRPLAQRFAHLPFVVPRARLDVARQRIGQDATIIAVTDGDRIEPLPGLIIHVLPSAHETLERDEAGDAVFLGYGVASHDLRLYHSGDCIPYEGLAERVSELAPDVALLPVNGRDASRLAAGIPGNFTLQEAVALCQQAKIDFMVPHHFGMFAFNTLDEAIIEQAQGDMIVPKLFKPVIGQRLCLDPQ